MFILLSKGFGAYCGVALSLLCLSVLFPSFCLISFFLSRYSYLLPFGSLHSSSCRSLEWLRWSVTLPLIASVDLSWLRWSILFVTVLISLRSLIASVNLASNRVGRYPCWRVWLCAEAYRQYLNCQARPCSSHTRLPTSRGELLQQTSGWEATRFICWNPIWFGRVEHILPKLAYHFMGAKPFSK